MAASREIKARQLATMDKVRVNVASSDSPRAALDLIEQALREPGPRFPEGEAVRAALRDYFGLPPLP